MKNIRTRIVFLDNKSRKGAHIYVTSDKGKGRYYKLQKGVPFDTYVDYYIDSYDKKRKIKGTLRQYESVFGGRPLKGKTKISRALKGYVTKKYAKAISSKKTISENIRKGITSYVMKSALDASESDVRNAYKECFRPLVLDKGLLDVLTLDSNIAKLVRRFEFKATLLDKSGTPIGIETTIGKKTLRQTISDLQKTFRKGMDFGQVSSGKKKLGKEGYSFEPRNSKNSLGDIELEIVFRY